MEHAATRSPMRRRATLLVLCSMAVVGVALAAATAHAQNDVGGLATYAYYVNHVSTEPFYERHGLDPNVVLHVKEVVMAGRERTAAGEGKVLLLVHGSIAPGHMVFDVPCEGCSMMRHFAREGWDVFTFDIEGYGNSTRPLIMEDPSAFPDDTAPIGADVVVADIGRVVAFVQALRGVDRVHLLGWSASATCEVPRFAASSPVDVASLVLVSGAYLAEGGRTPEEVDAWDEELKVFLRDPIEGEFGGTAADAYMPGLLAAHERALLASDPRSGEYGGRVRDPAGRNVFAHRNRPCYEAEAITAPTLVIRGENEPGVTREDNLALVEALGSDAAEYHEVPDAGHLAPYEEEGSVDFYEAVTTFLEER